MIFTIEAAKSNFFDRPKVMKAADGARRRALSKTGAFVRRRAQTSMPNRKTVSMPGSSPSTHVGFVRKFLFFGYDAITGSVAVGPVKLNRGDGRAPALLEHGGTVSRYLRGIAKVFRYRPRPFMRPALEKEISLMPQAWKDSIR